jgi:hypothetical protein
LNKPGNIFAILVLLIVTGWLLLLMTGVMHRVVDWMAAFVPSWMSIPIIVLLPISCGIVTIDLEINWKLRFVFFLSFTLSSSFLPVAERYHSRAGLITLGFTYLEMLWLMPKINKKLRRGAG